MDEDPCTTSSPLQAIAERRGSPIAWDWGFKHRKEGTEYAVGETKFNGDRASVKSPVKVLDTAQWIPELLQKRRR